MYDLYWYVVCHEKKMLIPEGCPLYFEPRQKTTGVLSVICIICIICIICTVSWSVRRVLKNLADPDELPYLRRAATENYDVRPVSSVSSV